ncbi:hypothetical protein H0G86_005490 [Trichoderma simmonsii]|uniref:Uncharacterized protein n=1 Tax=Trichoderma simmonsii TaxID=1491479 RepID=A0A8G0L9M8_9HYPO|nr:hypothetical protein H0G86_005490 [Trichoderma simmonsii]
MLATAWSINFAKPLLVPGTTRCPCSLKLLRPTLRNPAVDYPLFSANAATGQFDDTATNAGCVPFNTVNRT